MSEKDDKLKEIREDILEKKPAILKKKVGIIFDGRQYNLRIPKSFAEKARIDVKEDEFEFELVMPDLEKGETLPSLRGVLIEKEKGSEG